MHVILHVYYLRRFKVVATFLLRLLLFAGEGRILITLINFQGQQNLHDRNIVSLRENDVSWVISCDENINLIHHKLHPKYALVHTILREVKDVNASFLGLKTLCRMCRYSSWLKRRAMTLTAWIGSLIFVLVLWWQRFKYRKKTNFCHS